jgi:hypothetical protein
VSRTRNDIEHDIWVAAYLKALRDHSPQDAELVAINAARKYQARWDGRYELESFDALSYRHGEHEIDE